MGWNRYMAKPVMNTIRRYFITDKAYLHLLDLSARARPAQGSYRIPRPTCGGIDMTLL
jgi:hypothetical protein